MPKVEFKSNSKPSTFAYPPNLEEKKDKAKEKVETAVLSITAKQKKKEADKKKEEEKMEVVCSRKNCSFIHNGHYLTGISEPLTGARKCHLTAGGIGNLHAWRKDAFLTF